MNCTVIQRRLLSADHPEQPSEEIKSHLVHCASCRGWQRRLVQMERQIPQLPVPPSTSREQFLQDLVGAPSDKRKRQTIADPTNLWRHTLAPGPKDRALRKVSVAFALAASLLVFALAWWAWPHTPHPLSDTSVQEQVRLEQRLTHSLEGGTTQERVLRLAQLAQEIQGEAQKLVDNSDRLDQRAQFYVRVVSEHLIEQARLLPPEERREILNEVALTLSRAESDASRWGAQLQRTAPRSAASFERIALASRQGERDLRALLNG